MLKQISAFAFSCLLITAPAFAEPITVFAAASLKNAMEDLATAYEVETGDHIELALAGSSALARQIQQGAPADLFISANVGWMDELEGDGLIDPDSRRDLLANSLVLIGPEGSTSAEIDPDFDLLAGLEDGFLAMALVDAVPAGIYGKAALESLGLWASVEGQVAQADNVRAALALVSTGASPLGIVYATDALADPKVAVIGTFPEGSHPPILYPAAALPEADQAALDFLAYLGSDSARDVFIRWGFTPVDPG